MKNLLLLVLIAIVFASCSNTEEVIAIDKKTGKKITLFVTMDKYGTPPRVLEVVGLLPNEVEGDSLKTTAGTIMLHDMHWTTGEKRCAWNGLLVEWENDPRYIKRPSHRDYDDIGEVELRGEDQPVSEGLSFAYLDEENKWIATAPELQLPEK